MSTKTKISWTDATWNPVIGCSKVSIGCQNCYAERMTIRQNGMAAARDDNDNWAKYTDVLKFDYSQNELGRAVGWNGEVVCDSSRLDIPLHWKKPRRIFVCSMSDLFHEKVPFEFIGKVFATAIGAEQHIYQFLTKRPQRMLEFSMWFNKKTSLRLSSFAHLWLGVTVENQEMADNRIPILLQIPAAKRFVSAEPLLSEIDIRQYLRAWGDPFGEGRMTTENPPDWLIIGCETSPRRRPCKLEWVKSLIDQADAAGVPVHIKQLEINGKVSHDMNEWPQWARKREFPK